MHVKEHLKLSGTAALLAAPWLKQEVAIPFAASILIDVDHYAWHTITRRTLSLKAAMRYFGQADPPQLWQMRVLHHPLLLTTLLLLAARTRSRFLWLVLSGLLFHVSLDAVHVNRMSHLKRTLSEQAEQCCQECGQEFTALQLHTLHVSNNLLDRYHPRHFAVLCPACHEKAHCSEKTPRRVSTGVL